MSLNSFVKKGTRPQRASTISRSPDSLLCRMMGWCVVGELNAYIPSLASYIRDE